MFCCTKPNHDGEIVTNICQEEQCVSTATQLCCSECIKENHSSHSIVSMKKMLPELLKANNEKKFYMKLLEQFATFVDEQFGSDELFKQIMGTNTLSILNVIDVVQLILVDMKKKNKEENKKLKQIEKTLKLNNEGEKMSSAAKHLLPNYQSMLIKPSNPGQFGRQSKNFENIQLSSSDIASIELFSHTLKHPYITISPDMRSVSKTSQAGGYKLAALSASPIPEADNIFFNIKVVKSLGNILLGLAIPEIIKQKQYLNCYGAGHGAFLIGQNGNDPLSSILFHHSDNIFNRKQIVGWNYKEGEILGVGLIREEDMELISFRKYHLNSSGKPDFNKVLKQFTMPLWPRGSPSRRLHIIAILQGMHDQVEIIPSQQ